MISPSFQWRRALGLPTPPEQDTTIASLPPEHPFHGKEQVEEWEILLYRAHECITRKERMNFRRFLTHQAWRSPSMPPSSMALMYDRVLREKLSWGKDIKNHVKHWSTSEFAMLEVVDVWHMRVPVHSLSRIKAREAFNIAASANSETHIRYLCDPKFVWPTQVPELPKGGWLEKITDRLRGIGGHVHFPWVGGVAQHAPDLLENRKWTHAHHTKGVRWEGDEIYSEWEAQDALALLWLAGNTQSTQALDAAHAIWKNAPHSQAFLAACVNRIYQAIDIPSDLLSTPFVQWLGGDEIARYAGVEYGQLVSGLHVNPTQQAQVLWLYLLQNPHMIKEGHAGLLRHKLKDLPRPFDTHPLWQRFEFLLRERQALIDRNELKQAVSRPSLTGTFEPEPLESKRKM